MSLWRDEYIYEAGDIVEVIGESPYVGTRGVITACGGRQFQVTSPNFPNDSIFQRGGGGTMWLWAEDLKLISTHRQQIPPVFEESH